MKATVLLRNDNIFFNNKQNQNQLGDWFWFTSKPHRKGKTYSSALLEDELMIEAGGGGGSAGYLGPGVGGVGGGGNGGTDTSSGNAGGDG